MIVWVGAPRACLMFARARTVRPPLAAAPARPSSRQVVRRVARRVARLVGRHARAASLVGALLAVTACAPTSRPGRPSPVAAADSFARAMVQRERTIDPATFPARSVAVAPLQVVTRDTALRVLGFGLADLLMTDLARSAQLVVVDRLRLDAVLREQQLAESGRVEASTAPRTGRLIGARTLVVGEVRDAGGAPRGPLTITTRLVNSSDASVSSGPGSSAGLNQLLDAEKRIATDLFASLGVTLTPRERQLVMERPTASLAALLAYSRGVQRQAMGDLRGARAEFREAARLDRGFRQAQARAAEVSQALGEPALGPGGSRLLPVTELTVDVLNRPSVPIRSDAGDPAFTNARRLATLILTFTIP